MHRVKTTIRLIPPSDLPKVRGLDGKERAATPDELLNLGISSAGLPNLYSCREQENNHHATPDVPMVPVVLVPGKVLSEGPVQQRHDKLPADVKVDLWRAKVRKSVGRGKSNRVELVEVDAAQIKPTDDVVEAGIKKHRWAGESER